MSNHAQQVPPTVSDPLGFSDIYINFGDINASDVYYVGHTRRWPISEEQRTHVAELIKLITAKTDEGEDSFRLKYLNKLYRCTIINTIHGIIADLRSQPMEMIPLQKISIPPIIKQICGNQRLNRGGLILVVGAPGQGKTTTCAAILLARLRRYGGLCLAIEDPAELPLDGVHGEGRCIQMEIKDKEEYLEAGRLAMRCYPTDKPSMMFISEIRDGEGASLALRAALDGRLVIATMHADGVITAMKRLISLATTCIDRDAAMQLLFNGFRLCLHQTRKDEKIESSILVDTNSVAQLLRQGKFDQLCSEIDAQELCITQGKPIQTR